VHRNSRPLLLSKHRIVKLLVSTFFSCLLIFSLVLFNSSQYSSNLNAYAQDSANSLASSIGSIFGNISKAFNKQFEYTVVLDGKQLFPNKTLKENIVTKYETSTYNLSTLKYKLLGFNITASNIMIQISPSRIDDTKTRIDIPIMLAKNVTVSNGIINLKYNQVDLGSIYGIYDIPTDKVTVHIPLSTVAKYVRVT
jgi:hypothetical protein